jgi:anti-sigma factor RsiW
MSQHSRTRRKQAAPAKALCERATSLIADYLAGILDPETRSALDSHLRECDDCVAFLNTYKRTVRAVQSLRYEELPPDLQSRALQLVRKRLKR